MERIAQVGDLAQMAECPVCRSAEASEVCSHCGTVVRPGGYSIIRVLADRPFHRTYLAEDERGAKVVIKEIAIAKVRDVAQLESLEREAQNLLQLKHPQIPKFVRTFREGDGAAAHLYLVHEFESGEMLEEKLKTHRFSEGEAKKIARSLLGVLTYLHSLSPKLLHLDIRPENIIVDPDWNVRLVGFGWARDLRPEGSPLMNPGLIGYAAPEVVSGKPCEGSDLFAVGASLIHLLSRIQPEEVIGASARFDWRTQINVSENFKRWLAQLVHLNSKQRFQSASEASQRLENLDAPRSMRSSKRKWVLGALALAVSGIGLGWFRPKVPEYTASQGTTHVVSTGTAPFSDPSINGKYSQLLRKIEVPADAARYGQSHDWGYWTGTSWGGHSNLPPGYWVWVNPNWYIWGHRKEPSASRATSEGITAQRHWGPEQALGEPNTSQAGDIITAWASATADGANEWLSMGFGSGYVPKEIHVYETYNPGALSKVTGITAQGEEHVLWEGADPTPVGSGMGKSIIRVNNERNQAFERIKLYIDSRRVAGWNEIDAVALVDPAGATHWATSAEASSSYATR